MSISVEKLILKKWDIWNEYNFRVITMRGQGISFSWPWKLRMRQVDTDLRPSHAPTIFTTIFPKKSSWKSLPTFKTVEKIFAVVKNVVVCMDNNDFFIVSVVVCEGLKVEELWPSVHLSQWWACHDTKLWKLQCFTEKNKEFPSSNSSWSLISVEHLNQSNTVLSASHEAVAHIRFPGAARLITQWMENVSFYLVAWAPIWSWTCSSTIC